MAERAAAEARLVAEAQRQLDEALRQMLLPGLTEQQRQALLQQAIAASQQLQPFLQVMDRRAMRRAARQRERGPGAASDGSDSSEDPQLDLDMALQQQHAEQDAAGAESPPPPQEQQVVLQLVLEEAGGQAPGMGAAQPEQLPAGAAAPEEDSPADRMAAFGLLGLAAQLEQSKWGWALQKQCVRACALVLSGAYQPC